MRHVRKTAPGVRAGKVQKKNRTKRTPTYWNRRQPVTVFDREKPGRNYRHLLSTQRLIEFVELIPNWDTVSAGLDAVLLARGNDDCDGWYDNGVIGVCAWEAEIEVEWRGDYVAEHRTTLSRLDVPLEPSNGHVLCKFNEDTAMAFQLLHVFLHELGHHRDRMTTWNKRECDRGEKFAEQYALEQEAIVWECYSKRFRI